MAWILGTFLITLISETSQQFVPNIPAGCNKAICEDVPNYPESYISNIIEKLNKDKHEFGVIDPIDQLKLSRDDNEEYRDLCPTEQKIIYPKAAKHKTGTWHFVINRNDDPLQSVVIETCASGGDKSCGNGVDIVFTNGYVSRCKQKYIYRYMIGIDYKGNSFDIQTMLPSCCACVLSSIY